MTFQGTVFSALLTGLWRLLPKIAALRCFSCPLFFVLFSTLETKNQRKKRGFMVVVGSTNNGKQQPVDQCRGTVDQKDARHISRRLPVL
ncbi:uncharacterized protein B0J16DRAFT_330095 [Fusarium flagelliforme]|uniref:uncharacterized protein n=1 Tax=Fusarium flagelliforme TaxID=2675880 RepID=UPI001E8CECEF|nr:uncharacterized protein B0J16DRAFT_330095 [Fusarium flagelliforme]KAH7198243.1 hypothetical protein B0J16DRAFT_330095 [Fusarium flagelliforme]